MLLLAPVDGRNVPTRPRGRLDVVDFEGPMPYFRRTSEFAGEIVKSSVGGEVYAISEVVDQTLLLADCFGPFEGMNPGEVRSEDCGNFLSIQQALGEGELESSCWLPGAEDPADGRLPGTENVPPFETPRVRPLPSEAIAPSRRCGLEGVCGTCGALEFAAHAHIQDRMDRRWGG